MTFFFFSFFLLLLIYHTCYRLSDENHSAEHKLLSSIWLPSINKQQLIDNKARDPPVESI